MSMHAFGFSLIFTSSFFAEIYYISELYYHSLNQTNSRTFYDIPHLYHSYYLQIVLPTIIKRKKNLDRGFQCDQIFVD